MWNPNRSRRSSGVGGGGSGSRRASARHRSMSKRYSTTDSGNELYQILPTGSAMERRRSGVHRRSAVHGGSGHGGTSARAHGSRRRGMLLCAVVAALGLLVILGVGVGVGVGIGLVTGAATNAPAAVTPSNPTPSPSVPVGFPTVVPSAPSVSPGTPTVAPEPSSTPATTTPMPLSSATPSPTSTSQPATSTPTPLSSTTTLSPTNPPPSTPSPTNGPSVAASLLDAWSNGNAGGQTPTFTISAATNRLLVVAVATEDNFGSGSRAQVTSVRYGGQALAKAVEAVGTSTEFSNKAENGASLWILNEAGIAAATDTSVVVASAADGGIKWRCATYQNVPQAGNAVRDTASDAGTFGDPSRLTSGASLDVRTNDFVVAAWHASGDMLQAGFGGLMAGHQVFYDNVDEDPFAVGVYHHTTADIGNGEVSSNGDARRALAVAVIAGLTAVMVPNDAPIANAGADLIKLQNVVVTLDGSGSSDPEQDALTYTWAQLSGTPVALSATTTVQPSFTTPSGLSADEVLVFRLSVDDGNNAPTSDTVTVTVVVVNQPPTANAGADQVAFEGAQVQLNAAASTDRETPDTLTFAWTQTSGATVALSGANTATPTFVAPAVTGAAVLTFSVAVSDGVNAPQSDTVQVTVTEASEALLILPSDRRTTWNPGVYGGVPGDSAVLGVHPNGVGGATQYGPTLSASGGDDRAAIQAALNAAADVATRASRRFVKLGAGTFNVGGTISIPSNVVLRGTLSGTTRQSVLNQQFTGTLVAISGGSGSQWGPVKKAVGVQMKGSTTITVDDASVFAVGDVLSIDQLSDGSSWGPAAGAFTRPSVLEGGADTTPTGGMIAWVSSLWYQRQNYAKGRGVEGLFPDSPDPAGGAPESQSDMFRHISQKVEVLAIDGNTLTINDPSAPNGRVGSPLHTTFYNDPEVYKVSGTADVVRYAGLEDVKIEPSGTNGQRVVLLNKAYCCWVKNIEIDGNGAHQWSGRHVQLFQQTYRCEIRDSYFHESSNYSPGANGYGIVVSGSENLVENNVARTLNKPIVGECTCGGNVIAYNYVDEAIINTPTDSFHEAAISTHASFSHWDLYEGNLTPNINFDSTHGNNGWNVCFRNHCFGKNSGGAQTGYLRAIAADGWNWETTTVGNVLWSPGDDISYERFSSLRYPGLNPVFGGPEIGWLMGANAFVPGTGPKRGSDALDNGFSDSHLYIHKDYVYNGAESRLVEDIGNTAAMPNSLYLAAKPAFFGAAAWPWVNAEGGSDAERLKVLPAKVRFDGGNA